MIENVKIMVVEKDAMIRQFIVDVLEFSVNREVLGFENGTDALRHLKTGNHADMMMCSEDVPGISGQELLSTVKQSWPGMICILISDSYDNEHTICPTAVDSCLYKPFDTKDLFHIVQKFVVDGGPD